MKMSDIIIRPIEDSYIEGIVTISLLSFPITWSKASFEKELDNKFARYVVAVKNGIVVGYGGMWLIVDEAHITNIAVHPEFRHCRIGSLILEELIHICKLENIYGMTLEVRRSNHIAQKLYIKYGFVEEGIRKGYYEDNREDAIIMWKRDL
jgi:ribosomal-protein-alanine N-acetyltransferase